MKGQPKRFHFLGICGTAMGAVAAALRDRKFVVTGSDDNVYPPMSTHRGLTPNELQALGISEGLVRMSVGIEDAEDIIADLDQALAAAAA